MSVEETNLRAVVTLRDQMSPVLKSLQKEMRVVSRDMREGFSSISDAAKMAGAGIAAVAGAGAGVWYATTAAAETATQMDMMSRQTGVATERLQAWQATAIASGMEGQEFAEALRDMNIELSDAATGGKDELAQLLQKVGISARDAAGNIKTADQVFLDFADAVARQKDSAIQLRMAISAFGEDTGAKLLPMLQKGSQAFRESEAAMKAAGSAITQDQIDSLKSFRAEWESVKNQFSVASTSVLSTLAPALGALAEGLQAVIERIRPLLQERADGWARGLATAIDRIPWESIADKISALIEGGEKLREEFGVVGSAVAFAFEHIGEVIGLYVAGKTVKGVFDLYQGITTLGAGLGTLMKAALPLVSKASPLFLIGSVVVSLATVIIKNWDSISDRIKGIIDGVMSMFNGFVESMLGVGKKITEFFDSITPDFLKKRDAKVELEETINVNDHAPIATVNGLDQRLANVEYDEADAAALGLESGQQDVFSMAYEAAKSDQRAREQNDFWTSHISSQRLPSMTKAQPVQEHRYSGAVEVSFKNAPANMSLNGVRSDRGLTVDTSIDHGNLGVGPYAPAF